MMILDTISNLCTDPGLAVILATIKKFMNILWIIAPILAIIASVINATKLMSNPDEKKYKRLFFNSITALFFVLLLPVIINVVMGLFDSTFELAACWNAAEEISAAGQDSQYIEDDDKNKGGSMLRDPDDYEAMAPSSNSSYSFDGSSVTNTSVSKVIFVGDSRTIGMQQSVDDNSDVWSCKSAMGLNWMKSTGIPSIDSQITSGAAVVVLMGVNDLYQINDYISYMNNLVTSVVDRGAKLYFVSVNPTSRSKDYLNEDIDGFNERMKQGLSSHIQYIDTNSYLKDNGFSSGDGLHYSATTYKTIYNYIKDQL